MTTVLVTGASGHVGEQLSLRLQNAGWDVRVLVRTETQAASAQKQGWVPLVGDVTQPSTLTQGVRGAEFVLHCAAVGGPDLARAQAVNVEGTRALATLALESGVRRFVHVSTISVHGDPLPERVDEETPLAPADPVPYCATKAQGELVLGEIRARGLETVILRPGMICNATRSQWGNEMVERLRSKGWPEDLHPDDVMPWVHTSNLAEMAWLALTHPAAADETFLSVDRNVTMREFFGPIASALGKRVIVPDRPPVRSICRLDRLSTKLGYRPTHTFEGTMVELVALAKNPR